MLALLSSQTTQIRACLAACSLVRNSCWRKHICGLTAARARVDAQQKLARSLPRYVRGNFEKGVHWRAYYEMLICSYFINEHRRMAFIRWAIIFFIAFASTAEASKYPEGVGCGEGEEHLDRSFVAEISNTFMENPVIAGAYDLITLWDDIPSKDEALNWSNRPLKVQPEDAQYEYWEMKVSHGRSLPVPSSFCGTQHVVKLTLPDSIAEARGKIFQTKLGRVQQKAANGTDYYHGVFSREGFQLMYAQYASDRGLEPKNISKVELLTAGKMEKTARWAIMSFYIVYIDGNESPDFYAIEAAKATGDLPLDPNTGKPYPPGESGSTFYMANNLNESICNNKGCPHGYAFTPFSNENNIYTTRLRFGEGGLESFIVKSYSQHQPDTPYFSLSGALYPLRLEDDSEMIDGTALHMEAVFRTFALANVFDWDLVDPAPTESDHPLALAGVALKNTFVSVANDALRGIGQGFTFQLPWYEQPPVVPSVDARDWLSDSKVSSEHLKNLTSDFPNESVMGCNAVYAEYGNLGSTNEISIGRLFEANANDWIEISPHSTFTFQEIGRDEWTVYLLDSTRDVQLDVDLWKRRIFYSDKEGRRPLYRIINAKRDPGLPIYVPVSKIATKGKLGDETFVRSSEKAGGKNAGQPVWYNYGTRNGVHQKLYRWEQTPQSSENTLYLYQREQLGFSHKFDLGSSEWSEVLDEEQTNVNLLGPIVSSERGC